MSTVGSMSAEPAVIPGTVSHLGLGVDVEEGTLFVVTSVESRVEITFWHLAHIVLVKKLALITYEKKKIKSRNEILKR